AAPAASGPAQQPRGKRASKPAGGVGAAARRAASAGRDGLSFTERHRLDTLPGEIERLEREIARLEELLSDPELYSREPVKFAKATEALTARQEALAQAESDWLDLAERAEKAQG
ncbi:elongation factor 3, partial [Rhodobacteraceae bacterium WD3A24]